MNSCDDKQLIRVDVDGSPNSKNFHPHGFGVVVSPKNGQKSFFLPKKKKKKVLLVYLVNHRSDGEFVEIYEFQPDKHLLLWLQEVSSSEHFTYLNDVQPVVRGASSKLPDFYVTNSFKYEIKTWQNILFEAFFHPKWSKLVHCGLKDDPPGKETNIWVCTVVDDSLSFGNGVALSADKKQLYAISSGTTFMSIYNISSPSSLATKWKDVPTSTLCDNLYVDDQNGDVFVACHPDPLRLRKKMLVTKKNSKEAGSSAPSQVLKWDGNENWKEIFSCNGDEPCIEASSTGLYCRDANALLVGSIIDNGILRCQLTL
ncbi:hypothetical protein RFI_25617 [Reticulomyxa filosa]|uniref:SMP-30/Gluconolactonase/LRE-like region domain-containing protein n=1 Tax=Reticulomyxa filosa TaxID=46433 RepID=X6MFE2_RETFI|nr:hypothetical protein RFI_25617 [Reticulomyxa filosa]|eukprot:ETO11760.1 hypothetical protein RFI_25617 [Reticulomyxa filosa]